MMILSEFVGEVVSPVVGNALLISHYEAHQEFSC